MCSVEVCGSCGKEYHVVSIGRCPSSEKRGREFSGKEGVIRLENHWGVDVVVADALDDERVRNSANSHCYELMRVVDGQICRAVVQREGHGPVLL
jgi:hypothetical protein